MSNRLAIDFGTTRTKVAYRTASDRRPELLRFGGHQYLPFAPSLFYLPKNGGAILFGDQAERMLETDPAGVIDTVKRRRHNQTVRAGNGRSVPFVDLLTTLFDHVRSKAGRDVAAFGGNAPNEVVLTLPVCFGPNERDLWRDAAIKSGFVDVVLVDEPVAAALGWVKAGGDASKGLIIFDCGGGTVDWALLRGLGNKLSVDSSVPPGGLVDLGGHDIDTGLIELVEAHLAEQGVESLEFGSARRPKLLRELRRIKEAMSDALQPPEFMIDTTKIELTAQQVNDEISSRFVVNAAASFNRYLDRVHETNAGATLPLLIVGGGAKVGTLVQSINTEHVEIVGWDGSEFAPVLGAIEWFEGTDSDETGLQSTGKNEGRGPQNTSSDVLFLQGIELASSGLFTDAALSYCAAAQAGHVEAAIRLATLTTVSGKHVHLAQFERALLQLSDCGSGWAAYQLARLYTLGGDGMGVFKRDRVIEERNLKLASSYGIADAQAQYARNFRELAIEDRRRLAETAAQAGNAQAMYLLGTNEYQKNKIIQDEWLHRSAERDYGWAQSTLASSYAYRDDFQRARHYYSLAAKDGSDDGALFDLWIIDNVRRVGENSVFEDIESNVRYVVNRANGGDPVAQYISGIRANTNDWFKSYSKQGLGWMQNSAKQGYPFANKLLSGCHYVGNFYYFPNDHIEISKEISRKYAEASCVNKDAICIFWYASLCQDDQNQDEKVRGFNLMLEAANLGLSSAQYGVATSLIHGVGCVPSFGDAVKWLERSANHTDGVKARIMLGLIADMS